MDSDVEAEVLAQLLVFAEQTTDFVGVSDPWGRILYLNPAAMKRLGVADTTNLTLADLFPLDAFGLYYDEVRPQLLRTGAWTGEVMLNAAGSGAVAMYVSTTARIGPGGETNGGLVYAHELPRVGSPTVIGESDLDEVTGLPSWLAFDDRVRLVLGATHRDGEACALVLAEVFDMESIIESVGVVTTASIMRALAGRITRVARTIDVVGRVSENQLGLLLRGVRSHGEALRIGRTVCESLTDPPVTTAAGDFAVSIGCGVAFAKPGDDPINLIQQASATMSRETRNVRPAGTAATEPGSVIADPGTRTRSSATMADFRVAMSRGDVRPYAQPVVDLGSGARVGYRALPRWHHRGRGTLEAEAFVGFIADTTLANEVDLYVARETAAVLALAVEATPLRLYSPVSKRLIADDRTEQYLSEIASAFFLAMNQLRLQVARPLLDNWSPALQDALLSLRDADLGLALTGIEHAADAETVADSGFHELHLSLRLTQAVATDDDARRAASEIVRIAHDRGLIVGGEGVSHPQDHDALVEIGCDVATGDFYGMPMPVDTIE